MRNENDYNYNMKIDVIKAITDDQIKIPNSIPIPIYIQEAENLLAWCQDDKEELKAKGLDWTLVEDLQIRCGALIVAQAKWQRVQILRSEDENIWMRETQDGYDLRNELVHHFRFAFRDDSSLILSVGDISKRTTHKGMIQGLRDLYVLGINNRDLLTKIGFDFTMLGLAAKKAEELDSKYSAASCDREDYREAKKIRNQAFTHLKEAVDMIRKYGRFVFSRNAARLKGYRSKHLRKKGRRNTRRNTIPVPVPEPEPVTEPVTTDI
jgi:hypothetical protein